MKAYALRIDDVLPHTTPDHDGPHKVLKTEYYNEFIRIVTTEGQYQFHLTADVTFPRRSTGPQNHLSEPVLPRPGDLAVNDVIGPPNPGKSGDPRNQFDWDEYDEDDKQDLLDRYTTRLKQTGDYQIITKITFPIAQQLKGTARIYTLYVRDGSSHVYSCNLDERLTFPRENVKPLYEHRDRTVKRKLPEYGPYVSLISGRHAYFAEHQFGKGRWPSYIGPNDHNHEEGATVRPPKTRKEWLDWDFVGTRDGNHPKEPI